MLVLVLCAAQVAIACPTCQEGLAHDEQSNIIQGYFWSIIFMMSMPFLIFGGLATYFYLEIRKARRDGRLPTPAEMPS